MAVSARGTQLSRKRVELLRLQRYRIIAFCRFGLVPAVFDFALRNQRSEVRILSGVWSVGWRTDAFSFGSELITVTAPALVGKEKSVSGQIGGQEFLNRSRQGFYAYPAGNRLAANSCTRTRWWIFSGPDLLSAVSGLEVRDSPDSKNRLSSNDGFVFLMGCDQRVRAYHQNYRKPSRRPQSGDRVPL